MIGEPFSSSVLWTTDNKKGRLKKGKKNFLERQGIFNDAWAAEAKMSNLKIPMTNEKQ